jgi:hypothetical protein
VWLDQLHNPCHVSLVELIQPHTFLLMRFLKTRDDLLESARNDALRFDRKRQPLAEVKPIAMRYQNVVKELAQFVIIRGYVVPLDRHKHRRIGVRLVVKEFSYDRSHSPSLHCTVVANALNSERQRKPCR